MQCGLTTFYCLTNCQSCPSAEDHDCFHFEDVTLDCRKYKNKVVATFFLIILLICTLETSSLFIDLDITGGYCNL